MRKELYVHVLGQKNVLGCRAGFEKCGKGYARYQSAPGNTRANKFPRGIPIRRGERAKSDSHRRAKGGGEGTGHSSGKLREIREYSCAFIAGPSKDVRSESIPLPLLRKQKVIYSRARSEANAEGSYLETSREDKARGPPLSHLTPSSRLYVPSIVSRRDATSRIAMRRERERSSAFSCFNPAFVNRISPLSLARAREFPRKCTCVLSISSVLFPLSLSLSPCDCKINCINFNSIRKIPDFDCMYTNCIKMHGLL